MRVSKRVWLLSSLLLDLNFDYNFLPVYLLLLFYHFKRTVVKERNHSLDLSQVIFQLLFSLQLFCLIQVLKFILLLLHSLFFQVFLNSDDNIQLKAILKLIVLFINACFWHGNSG